VSHRGKSPQLMRGSLGRRLLTEVSYLRSFTLRVSLLATAACTGAGAAQTMDERDLLVSPLPACYLLGFEGGDRPETDLGEFPDTITLTRPFEVYDREAEGHVYAGIWPDSLLPQSIPMANVFRGPLVTWWTSTVDSLILGAPGNLRVVSIRLGKKLAGLWYEDHDLGKRRTGRVRSSRIPCQRQ
jgi:hypothetical protein